MSIIRPHCDSLYQYPACGYCAASHLTKDCKKESAKKCVLCSWPNKTWDPRCEHKKKDLKRISIARNNTPCKYEIKHPPVPPVTNHFPTPSLPRGQLFTAQPSSSTLAPAVLKSNKRTAGEVRSLSPAKNSSNQRETRATAALNSQTTNRILLAAITRTQKSRKQMNHKVQVFEAKNPNERPDTEIDDQEINHQADICKYRMQWPYNHLSLFCNTVPKSQENKLWYLFLMIRKPCFLMSLLSRSLGEIANFW